MKITKKQKAILKSYARGVLVSFLTFLGSSIAIEPSSKITLPTEVFPISLPYGAIFPAMILRDSEASKSEVAKHLAWILEKEVISYTLEDIKAIVNQYYPDLRKCINTIQLNSKDSTLKLDNSILVSSNYVDKI